MELSKKTTVLFSPDLHHRLVRMARQKGVSMGELVRSACEKQYGFFDKQSRIDAVGRLAELHLPVADTRTMKEQSVPDAEQLCS